mgnify:CR=1 FL=1
MQVKYYLRFIHLQQVAIHRNRKHLHGNTLDICIRINRISIEK